MGWPVFSNLYVALCGAALTVATYPLLGLPARVDAAVALVFSATLVVYNLDRLVEPTPGDTAHEQWVAQHRGVLWGLTSLAALGCGVACWWLTPMARWSLVVPAALALGYCLPIVPRLPGGETTTKRWLRLKELPGTKLLLIGVVWAYATAMLPALQANADLATWSMAVILVGRLLFLLAVALPFDVPDMARDRAAGIVTLPQRVGLAGARRAALLLTLGFGVTAVFHPWPMAAALVVSAAVTAALLFQMNDRRGVVYYAVGLDGLLLVQSLLLLAVAPGR